MDELRIILLAVGAAVLAAVYFLGRPGKPRQAQSQKDADRAADGEPRDRPPAGTLRAHDEDPPRETLSRELKRLGKLISGERREHGAGTDATGETAGTDETDNGVGQDFEKIVVIYVRAREGSRLAGPELTSAAEKAGLEFGDMDIYHRLDESGERETIFSMANMVAPGTLARAGMQQFSTPGVALFLRLPGPLSALDAWDAMLATATRLSGLLDAELLDESHSTLNRQRIQQLREEMREFDRLATLEIGKQRP